MNDPVLAATDGKKRW